MQLAEVQNTISILIYCVGSGGVGLLLIAARHLNDVEEAIIQNTNLAGDTTNRGAALGALLGAINGKKGIPARWINDLYNKQQWESTVQQFIAALP